MKKNFNIIILLSGNGSTFQAITDRIKQEHWPINIAAVISDNPNAYGLTRAKQAHIHTEVIDYKAINDKETYHAALQKNIDAFKPDLIVLAGYMRILSADFVNHYPKKIINIHPALLPKFRGTNTHQRALEANETEHGTTIHIVTADLDAGPIIAQQKVTISKGETVESLQAKVKALEHQLYPDVIYQIAIGKIKL